MKDLNYELMQLCRRNKDGSFKTQADRKNMLMLCANQLDELGFKKMSASSLRPKHVEALLLKWQSEGLGEGTLKNRMCALRWWAEKVGKKGLLTANNSDYQIGRRETVARVSKALVDDGQVDTIPDPNVRASVRLQIVFGLRREEAMKIRPALADRGDLLFLKGSWCKGGRDRMVPILTAEQREALDEAKKLAGSGSLIPEQLSYKEHMKHFERLTRKAGIGRTHGFRHKYAQDRYANLSGMNSPVQGGPSTRQMTELEREEDHAAKLQVSSELGHARKEVTGAYLGGLISLGVSGTQDK